MKAKTLLALVCLLTLGAAAQDASGRLTQAECKFSDGNKITVTYSTERKNYLFSTDENLVTVKGIRVPAGGYTIVRAWDRDDQYFLIMRAKTETGQTTDLPRMPLSASRSASPLGNFPVSFDHTGGSCTMHLASEKSNTLLSLEFTEKNTDLPALP